MPIARLCFVLPADLDEIFAGIENSDNHKPAKQPLSRRVSKLLRRSLHRICNWNWIGLLKFPPPPQPDSPEFHDITGISLSGRHSNNNHPRIFSYAELYIGSNGFSPAEILGSGGFGRVYRAVLPSDGTTVAVKCVAEKGERFEKTFAAELIAVAELRHRNLVRLRGWCAERDELLLVYDYMSNGSLDRFLFRRGCGGLDWERRRRIISGLAAALFYLHEQLERQIIHRDVKTSNVMLDADYNARLGDFGLARWLEHELEQVAPESLSYSRSNHLFRLVETSKIGGTIGYLSPESFSRKTATTAKSDVFSFGIVVLEVISGRRAVDLTFPDEQIVLLDWVRRLSDAGNFILAGDNRLSDGSFRLSEMHTLVHLALLCSLNEPESRPTMKWVMEALSGGFSGELPALPSFHTLPLYISLSSSSTKNTNTSASIYFSATSTSNSSLDSGYNRSFSGGTNRFFSTIPAIDTPREIPFKELVIATNNFSQMVSEMDFGTAYHGYLNGNDNNKIHILVKRLGMKTCPALRARFSDELCNLGRLRHRNLVQLRGWCTEQGEMLVVYDYLANQSLAKLLFHRKNPKLNVLEWSQRYNIVKSLASALLYLHEEWEEQVIHKCVTSNSICLDSDLNPRLGSFALAEFLSRKDHGHHPVSRSGSVKGIFGYISPEYVESGEATTMADVYSFGVVLLEVVCGRKAVDFRLPEVLLVKRVRGLESRGSFLDCVDPNLDGKFDGGELLRLLKLGLICTRLDDQSRPSMREIVSIIDGNDECLNHVMMKSNRGETSEEWEMKNASSLDLVKRIKALGID